jgi:hypothetical protein
MPYKILKNKGLKDYKLILESTGAVLAKHTTKAKALKQIQAIEINKKIKKVKK